MTAHPSLFSTLRDRAFDIEQRIARDEYMGSDLDLCQLQRDVAALAIIVSELADAAVGAETAE